MSTRTYNLRNRLDAGIANQPAGQLASALHRPLTPPVRDLPSHMPGGPPHNDSPVALYSDIVASRSPSLLKESSSATADHPVVEPVAGRLPVGSSRHEFSVVPSVGGNIPHERIILDKTIISPQDPGDESWTTVRRRRARSLESLEPLGKSRSSSSGAKPKEAPGSKKRT